MRHADIRTTLAIYVGDDDQGAPEAVAALPSVLPKRPRLRAV